MVVIKGEKSGYEIFTKVFHKILCNKKYDTEYAWNFLNWLIDKGKGDGFEDILRDVFPNGTDLDEYYSYIADNYKDIGAKMGFTN